MKNTFKTLLILITLIMPMGVNANETGEENSGELLKKVEAKYVCMINNRLFDSPQIPTEVNGKTYYGCCPMCKAKLENNVDARTSTDPVSKNIVDKATAIIGAQADGTVHYFENEENMKKFVNHKK